MKIPSCGEAKSELEAKALELADVVSSIAGAPIFILGGAPAAHESLAGSSHVSLAFFWPDPL